jgi:hypothetical protein
MSLTQPDRDFVARLKKLDPKLGCKFVPEHEHFVITYARPVGEPVNVWLIQAEGGGFRHPDERDLRKLQESDLQRVPMKDRLKEAALYMERDREHRRRKRKEEIRDRTKDDKIQLMRAAAQFDSASGGKHNQAYRRVDLKPKGTTIK